MIITVLTIFSVVTVVTPTMIPLSIPSTALSASSIGNIATNRNLGLCVVPAGNAVGNGVPVQLAPCVQGGSPWLYDDTKKTLTVTGTNQCLDVKDGINANGTRLQTWQCTGGPNQKFQLARFPRNPQFFEIQWVGSGKCADVTGGVYAPGTPLQIWECDLIFETRPQAFFFPETPPKIRFRPTAHPEFCIDVRGGSSADGTALQIHTCNGTPAQTFQPADGGFHVFGNSAIDLTNAVQTDGNKLQIWTAFPGNTNQHWIYDAVNRAIRLTVNPNKCIDVTNGVFAQDTPLQIWDCTFGPNQQFSVEAV